VFTLQARTVIHPEPGVSEPLLLGTLQQPLGKRLRTPEEQQQQQIHLEEEAFARLRRLAQAQEAAPPSEGTLQEPPLAQS
jgi:hypothetical protein